MRLKFNLGAVMTNASDLSNGAWTSATLQLNVTDWEGVYTGTDIAVGDSVWLDTSGYEPGTLTQYEITAIGTRTASAATVTVVFLTTDHAAPDLSYAIGARAVVSRPGLRDLCPVPSPGTQQVPDKLAFYLLNANSQILGSDAQTHASGITRDGQDRVTGFTIGSDNYVVSYGANGLSTITKNGQAHITAVYTAGKITSFNLVQEGGETVVIDWIPGLGQVATISLNTLAAINPANDPLANPNYPAAPPWEFGSSNWTHCLDFGSVFMCDDLGTHGMIVFYTAAGHSAPNATMLAAFDLAKRQWQRLGRRSLPNDSLNLGANAYPGVYDPTWGDYNGAASEWGAFAQPGYNPPAGSHAYGGMTYRPANKAGNTGGQILYPLNASGGSGGNGARGSWVWDSDTELWERSTNLRPDPGGATVGGTEYFESVDAAFALNVANSTWLMTLDWFDWPTKTWTRRYSATTQYSIGLSGLSFAHQSASLYCIADVNNGALRFYAAPVDKVAAGTTWAWSELTVTNSSGDAIPTVHWIWHDTKQCFYGAGYQPSQGHYLYKLTPPGTTQAQCLSGTWVLTRETLGGESLVFKNANGVDADIYNLGFLNYSKKLDCLFWMSPYVGGPVQVVVPGA